MSDIYNDPTVPPITNRDSFIMIYNSKFTNLNFYSQVNSLAITGANKVTTEFKTGVFEGEEFEMSNIVNMGIVLNVEDFGGRIEIVGSKFERNFHYLPGI